MSITPRPEGAITLLATDIEGSTRLWEQQPEAMRQALERHDALLRRSIQANEGEIFKTGGDGFWAGFRSARAALAAAIEAQKALRELEGQDTLNLRVRMALHAAAGFDGSYFGPAANSLGRVLDAAAGGQVLLTLAAAEIARDVLPDGGALRDLGLHRLRDLQHAERVFQLLIPGLPGEFPPLESQTAARNNLPVQLSSFVGRERELAQAMRLLERGRLLTLTGPGGSGKTRLGIRVAEESAARFGDGVWMAELAHLTDGALVARAVAEALEVREDPGQPVREALLERLRDRRCLLLLDNCEHLLDDCARLVDSLLRSCGGISVLATSREPLGIAGEVPWMVPPLRTPVAGELPGGQDLPRALESYESVRLFTERACAANNQFKITADNAPAVANICQRLDGIPLAIELAAARVKVLTVQQVSARLDDRFRLLTGGSRSSLPRQQTLRALIDWSYDLLTAGEQEALCRLAVFTGGCTCAAAEAQWGSDMLDVLLRLVDRSLLIADEGLAGETRYRMLESVRAYGLEKLEAAGERELAWRQHRRWVAGLAEEAEPMLQGPDQDLWMDRLEWERDNIRAAMERAGDYELRLRVAGAIWRFWFVRGHFSEGLAACESALAGRAEAPAPVAARALKGAGNLAWALGDLERARGWHQEAMDLYRAASDGAGVAAELNNLANISRDDGDLAAARRLLEESLTIYREEGDTGGIALTLSNLGGIAMEMGDRETARRCLRESLEIQAQRADTLAVSATLHNLGELAAESDDFADARELFRESLEMRWEVGDRSGLAYSLASLGFVADSEGDYTRAARLLAAAESERVQTGVTMADSDREMLEQRMQDLRDRLDAQQFADAWREGESMGADRAVVYALGREP